jgi:hypothetical protein
MSLAKYISPLLAAQIPGDMLQEASSGAAVFPIPPMLEDGFTLDQIETMAERRGDDLCDLGSLSASDDTTRLQMAAFGCQEYAQAYLSYTSSTSYLNAAPSQATVDLPSPDEIDAEELMLQTMPDRQKLTEMGKLVGTARYALDGYDRTLLQETRQRLERLGRLLADKYRSQEIINSAFDPDKRGAKLAELYLSRAFKLVDEEYADIPEIERAIRELREQA